MWIDEASSTVYRHEAEVRVAFPNVSFPPILADEDVAPLGLARVLPTQSPGYDSLLEIVQELPPVRVDGQWWQAWSVVPASEHEVALRTIALRAEITAAVQERLDSFAQSRGYDNIVSACSYATSNHPRYGVEGRYCVQARESTWDAVFQIEGAIQAGQRQMPRAYAEVESELPVLVWPG